jgi:hypothetical protein
MTKVSQILPNNVCINFVNHVGLINDSQVVILHNTLKCVYQKDFSYWSETVFTFKVNMTLTFDLKINKGYLLAKTNAPVKFEGKGPMSCWDIDKAFLYIRSM